MQVLHDVAKPGLMLSQTWPTSRETEGETLRGFETALNRDFFWSFQTVEIPYSDERKKVAHLLKEEPYSYTYCIARVLNENKLDLSDLDATNRQRSCDQVIRCLDEAREAGAGALSFISGPTPEALEQRSEALKCLHDSIEKIAVEAKKDPEVNLIVEPLDVEAHKKRTLGYTSEAIALCRELEQKGTKLYLCLDTAHLLLNGEDPDEALRDARDYVTEFHYCNCVVDPSHPIYGDRHIHFGDPGVLDFEGIARLMAKQVEMGYFDTVKRPAVMCEVLKQEADQSAWIMEHCIEALNTGWELAQREIGTGKER